MGIHGMSELKNAELYANSLFEQFITEKQFTTCFARRTIERYRDPMMRGIRRLEFTRFTWHYPHS